MQLLGFKIPPRLHDITVCFTETQECMHVLMLLARAHGKVRMDVACQAVV